MIDELLLHLRTRTALEAFINRPVHALSIVAPTGSGKAWLAQAVARRVLSDGSRDNIVYEEHPSIRLIAPVDGKAIPIESIRSLQQFISLKMVGTANGLFRRVIVIEDAQLLTIEAQNALLKTLEEPPQDTLLILTATSSDAVLPTIRSRVRQLSLQPPTYQDCVEYFIRRGHISETVNKALLLAGELPGLINALLTNDDQHPLLIATTHARGILQSKAYERLLLVDGLSKQKQLCLDILYVIGRMSRMSLLRTTDTRAQLRWMTILKASYVAERQLRRNVQAKLALTNLMQSI